MGGGRLREVVAHVGLIICLKLNTSIKIPDFKICLRSHRQCKFTKNSQSHEKIRTIRAPFFQVSLRIRHVGVENSSCIRSFVLIGPHSQTFIRISRLTSPLVIIYIFKDLIFVNKSHKIVQSGDHSNFFSLYHQTGCQKTSTKGVKYCC